MSGNLKDLDATGCCPDPSDLEAWHDCCHCCKGEVTFPVLYYIKMGIGKRLFRLFCWSSNKNMRYHIDATSVLLLFKMINQLPTL